MKIKYYFVIKMLDSFYFKLVFILFISAQSVFSKGNNLNTINEPVKIFDIKKESFFLPQHNPYKKYSHCLALYYVVPPKDWTHDIVNAPFFKYSGKYSLAKGFTLQADFSTIFVSNRIAAGPFWNYSMENFHLGFGYQAAFNYGILKQFGFKTVVTGWEQQPSLTLGYSFENTAVIVRTDLYYTTSLNFIEDGFVVSSPENFTNGYSVTTCFEQRLHKNRCISLGLKINYLRYHIIAWPALPVNSYRYVIPEFQICLIL